MRSRLLLWDMCLFWSRRTIRFRQTSGSDNPELGIEALTQVVREVLEEVFEARIRGTSEMLQARYGCECFDVLIRA
ncbi:hypothetical protein PVK06_024238 [Gossypium arboreum]|uniref:Uncharacterized protein n=1 Tax=Gossypium arboreum TaxID=29729 RepID=A0ABR0PD85_GOSAR|nr:hypothetical protein PVK06_024238 [Gossypium arboreum]